MKIYIASKSVHGPRWAAMRARGAPFISSWIDESGPGQTSDWSDLTARCVTEAAEADALIVYAMLGETLKGALIEWGAALAAGTPVIYVGPPHRWTAHPLVRTADSVQQAVRLLQLESNIRVAESARGTRLGKKQGVPIWAWPFVWIGGWLRGDRDQ